MNKILNNFFTKFLTISRGNSEILKSREVSTPSIREINKPAFSSSKHPVTVAMDSFSCPYCASKNFVKRGFRQKKMEKVQLYLCLDCNKTFTQQITRGKHYPLPIIFDAISIYNLGYSLEQTCRIVNKRQQKTTLSSGSLANTHTDVVVSGLSKTSMLQQNNFVKSLSLKKSVDPRGMDLRPSTLSNWLTETSELCRFERMRPYALRKYSPKDMVISATLAHRQLYQYRFHRAKCDLIIQDDFKNRRFGPIQEFLEMVPGECPHQYFQEGQRASEVPLTFSKTQMIVRSKQNFATKLAAFVLQSVKDRKQRHETLQKFMLANDTVTIATEIPVYITKDDIQHMQTQLGFEIYRPADKLVEPLESQFLPKLITGHIDILQIRNGQVHILDFKPKAEKQKPIEQLTLYAMALSRLTGLRLFEFKCAWFDEKDYFEFFPLHVLHKLKKRRQRKVYTMEGVYKINQDKKKISSLRPTNLKPKEYVIH